MAEFVRVTLIPGDYVEAFSLAAIFGSFFLFFFSYPLIFYTTLVAGFAAKVSVLMILRLQAKLFLSLFRGKNSFDCCAQGVG